MMATVTRWQVALAAGLSVGVMAAALAWWMRSPEPQTHLSPLAGSYQPRRGIDTAGFALSAASIPDWDPSASLESIRAASIDATARAIESIDTQIRHSAHLTPRQVFAQLHRKTLLLNSLGRTDDAIAVLDQNRVLAETHADIGRDALFSVIFLQGVAALRRGENENCILCRGESSCILPISPAARHTRPEGSRQAIRYFLEYLEKFPDDREVQWLLNVAHMTLGEHPDGVDPRYVINLDHFTNSQDGIGRFRDVGHRVGVNTLSQSGGAILEDFDNDGLLDIVVTDYDPAGQMRMFRGTVTGQFEDVTQAAGLSSQYGGLNCVQVDYDHDGWMDIFIMRGAWQRLPIRASLLRNDGTGTFTDVTVAAGLSEPSNTIAAQWADFDRDGHPDLFVCGERQPSWLYRNLGNGSFQDVLGSSGIQTGPGPCKGVAWGDFDNDGFPDLYLNYLTPEPRAQLFRNERDGRFREVGMTHGIDGPAMGFSCWAWDYNNDGWLDVMSTCYDTSLGDVVQGLTGQPHSRQSSRLYRNRAGNGFDDVTQEAGLDVVLAAMGSNFADFDNDGHLDFYVGTGAPDLAMLVPNRMFRNLGGDRFVDITASSGTGHLQKGHGVACGDWDRDGNVDLFVQMGGAVPGDQYHDILFQNPGHDHAWITLRLVGKDANRAAVGARLKIVTRGPAPKTVYRHVRSGSSFGANPLELTIGLGDATHIESLVIEWPSASAPQVVQDLLINQSYLIQEHATSAWRLPTAQLPDPLSLPDADASPR